MKLNYILGALCVVASSSACLAHAQSPEPVRVYSQPGWCTWRRAEKPIFPEDPRRAMCSNPSVCELPDGRILMVYKWMVSPWSTNPEVHLGAAIAARPEGPFEIVNENVFPAPGARFAGEDPCL